MILFLILAIIFLVLWRKAVSAQNSIQKQLATTEKERQAQLDEANKQLSALEKYKSILDAEAEAAKIKSSSEAEAKSVKAAAEAEASHIREEASQTLTSAKEQLANAEQDAHARINRAETESQRIIADAKVKAEEIAGDAYKSLERVDELKSLERALTNTIKGYGDEWLKPTYSLLDDLAEDFNHTDAGVKLKEARAHTARMVTDGTAAVCDYVESNRKETAIRFVIDAFNGKVDSILSKTKKDNYGKLEQQIKDAYQLVNTNGAAFRNARITPAYLDARLQELHWAVIVTELKAKAAEEQRELREKMREEAKAQREFERAQKEAAKEEAMLQKAMEKAQAQLMKATEEQKAKFEAQLTELAEKLKEAQEKNQRAISQAQQTKHGNVYVISNIGSFGEGVYKVGMTRRLEPMDRVRELGDASVPFSFDVHAIIESDDAPALEHALHQELTLMQVNKVNPRKEFFKANLSDIRALVEKYGLSAKWTMEAEAAEYRETIAIEERMKNDPDAQKRWAEFYERIAEDKDTTESEEEDT
jgi:hypothetical protein